MEKLLRYFHYAESFMAGLAFGGCVLLLWRVRRLERGLSGLDGWADMVDDELWPEKNGEGS